MPQQFLEYRSDNEFIFGLHKKSYYRRKSPKVICSEETKIEFFIKIAKILSEKNVNIARCKIYHLNMVAEKSFS